MYDFLRLVAANGKEKKTIHVKADLDLVRATYEREIADLKMQLSEAKSASALNGIIVKEKTTEQRVQEMLDKRDFEQLEKLEEAQKSLGYVEIAKTVGPVLLPITSKPSPKNAGIHW